MYVTSLLADNNPQAPDTDTEVTFQEDGSFGVTIGVQGCGMNSMPDDFDQVIYIEKKNGIVRLLVWADINSGDPTHVIELDGALLTKRKDAE